MISWVEWRWGVVGSVMCIWNSDNSYFLLALHITFRSWEKINHVFDYVNGISHKAEKLFKCLKNKVEKIIENVEYSKIFCFFFFVETPSFEELVSIYCRCQGVSTTLSNFNFFLALSYFKMAAISQVIHSHLLKCHIILLWVFVVGNTCSTYE